MGMGGLPEIERQYEVFLEQISLMVSEQRSQRLFLDSHGATVPFLAL